MLFRFPQIIEAFEKLFILFWSIADKQCWDTFWWTARRLSLSYTCIHSSANSSPIQAATSCLTQYFWRSGSINKGSLSGFPRFFGVVFPQICFEKDLAECKVASMANDDRNWKPVVQENRASQPSLYTRITWGILLKECVRSRRSEGKPETLQF